MTVIAWDGKTLAADKQYTNAGIRRTGTKIFRLRDGLAAICGRASESLEMLEWLRGERKPESFPAVCRNSDDSLVVVVAGGKVYSYENTPYPMVYEDPFFAAGSGRDYAMAAMHCGKTAAEAVDIACLYESGCGMGIDVMTP